MATHTRHPPSAACLSASMRDMGYSLETAVADLVDNSITAKAAQNHPILAEAKALFGGEMGPIELLGLNEENDP